MRRIHSLVVALTVAAAPLVAQTSSQPIDTSAVMLAGPTLIGFIRHGSNAATARGHAASLDQVGAMVTRAGVAVERREAVHFTVRDAEATREFTADADSAAVGYVLVAPGRDLEVHYGVWARDDLLDWIISYVHHGPDGQMPTRRRVR